MIQIYLQILVYVQLNSKHDKLLYFTQQIQTVISKMILEDSRQ